MVVLQPGASAGRAARCGHSASHAHELIVPLVARRSHDTLGSCLRLACAHDRRGGLLMDTVGLADLDLHKTGTRKCLLKLLVS
jgi:hypothetical protein